MAQKNATPSKAQQSVLKANGLNPLVWVGPEGVSALHDCEALAHRRREAHRKEGGGLMALFTPEEREALRLIDEEIDEDFRQTQEEIEASRKRDRTAKLEAMDPKARKIAAQKAAYRADHREAYNAYMREYMRKRRRRMAAR